MEEGQREDHQSGGWWLKVWTVVEKIVPALSFVQYHLGHLFQH